MTSRQTRPLLLFLLLIVSTLPPLGAAAHSEAVMAEGPDADGAYRLFFDIHRDAAGPVDLRFDVVRDDGVDRVNGTRALPTTEFAAGTTRWNATFLPIEGAGDYAVTLVLDDAQGPTLHFQVQDGDGASTNVTFDVADAPTHLNLTSDSVNADGKLKSPGDELLTRAVLQDDNGLAELDTLRFLVQRPSTSGPPAAGGAVAFDATGTSTNVEHRFAHSPLAADNYTLTLLAVKDNTSVASATRTFVIRDVAPELLAPTVPPVTPDENRTLPLDVVLGDRNGHPGEGTLEGRIYRGSSRAEDDGFTLQPTNVSLSQGVRLADAGGMGRTQYPFALSVPAGAEAGAYRVSLYLDGSLLGTLPFEVLALPTLSAVEATSVDGNLQLRVVGTGNGTLVATLADQSGGKSTTGARLVDGHANVTLTPPAGAGPMSWRLELSASSGGTVLDAREGTWNRTTQGPALDIVPVRPGPRLPAVWRVNSSASLDAAQASIEVRRWDGTIEPAITGSVKGDRVVLEGPPDLAPGRYHVTLRATWSDGSASRADWSFEAGPWVRIELGAANVTSREARLSVENRGGLTIAGLVVEAVPNVDAVIVETAGTPSAGDARGTGRWAFRGLDLAPGEAAELVVRLPEGPLPAGAHGVHVRVYARAGGA